MSFQLGSVNKQFNTESQSFQKSFNLTHKQDSIFSHEFDGGDPATILLGSNTFVIKNHFLVTGEKLEYNAAGNSAIGIDHTSSGIGAGTTIPSTVYAIKVDENRFKIAASKSLALSSDAIGITTVGVGSTHRFNCFKQNTKCMISVDNVLQQPLVVKTGTATTTENTMLNREVRFTDTRGFKQYDLIKIDDEIMRIQVIGFGTMANNVLLDRAFLGTFETFHVRNAPVKLLQGDYNIVQDRIHFKDVPFGGTRQTVGVSSVAVDFANDSFTALTEVFNTGTQVKLRSINPPSPLIGNEDYYIIKNAPNNFSFADTKGLALVGTAVTLTSSGIGTHKLLVADVVEGSSFQGRAFIRSDYTGNLIVDDISDDFTGIAKTYTMKSGGSDITGITTDFGVILLNNQFQKPDIDYDFVGGSTTGITSIRFTGNDFEGQSETYSTSDVNANRLPRRGIIAGFGNTQGWGYQRLQAGFGTAVVSGFGTITAAIGFTGSGYRGDNTVFKVRVRGGSPTTGAAGTFSVLNGNISKIWMGTPGVGYTWTDVPLIEFDSPYGYDDLKLVSSGTGIGASITVNVSTGNSISAPVITNTGYGYTVGEQIQIVGIPTVATAGTNFTPAQFTITETSDDKFAAWTLGKFQILDDWSHLFNGSRTQFTLTENNSAVSIEKTIGSPISLDDILLIFINDVLQKPGVAYNFDGGTQVKFTEAPAAGSSLQVLFYRGTDADVTTTEAVETIKKGDKITIDSPPSQRSILPQEERTIREPVSRETLQTTIYKSQGIYSGKTPLRPVTWSKQVDDKLIDGIKVSKSRGLYSSGIHPATRIIANVGPLDTKVYGQSGLINFRMSEDPNTSSFTIRIVDTEKNNTGFGTTGFTNPFKEKEGVTLLGDHGTITGIGCSAKGIVFELHIPTNSDIRQTKLGGLTNTGIGTGDYFVVSNSNVGAGVTARSSNGASTIGIATQFLDGVYQCSHLTRVGTGQTMRVHAEVMSGHGLNFTGLSSGVSNYYGSYSWARFTTTAVGLAYTVNTLNGLTGLSTAPEIQRTAKLSLDYT
tara:strand:- start:9919 stop:13056 length:3138 start_codon:yes stop_codon:yes gene_type:complete